MPGDRVTVSLTDDAQSSLEQLTERTDENRSEIIREAISFYAANFESARASDSDDLQTYYRMLTTGEHVLLDVDLLHAFLDNVEGEDGPDPEFLETVDRVAEYHTQEYAQRFDSLGEILEWLSFCGFLTVRQTEGNSYQVVFPSESVRWFMVRFIQGSIGDLPFEVEIEESVSKVLLRECER
ncbi:ribbon-helix-helix protein, CopG family [Halorientalis pallida]|uniref:ribbon-helix-helix protein, CopG family n=1 Tax=Halorientalis pallida TaxID=2479928 RepID=UPI003C6FAAC5